jgi:hypothetical protein
MNRRDFVRMIGAGGGLVPWVSPESAAASGAARGKWQRGDPIPYVRGEIPGFSVSPYDGERYEAMVPDTLDIEERAALAVNGLTGPLDAQKDYMLYFGVSFKSNPPSMYHGSSDVRVAKFEEALPLLRLASGRLSVS